MRLTLDGSGPVKTPLRGRSWPQRDPQPTGSFLPSVVELYFLSILCVGHFSKQFACVSPDRNTMRYVLCLVLISHMGKLRHRAVKHLAQGHTGRNERIQDPNSGNLAAEQAQNCLPSFIIPTFFRPVFSKTSPQDQQHQHHLETSWKTHSQAAQEPPESEILGLGYSSLCLESLPGDSESHSSSRITALEG